MSENFEGSPEDCSRYISSLGQDEQDLSVHAAGSSELNWNCGSAAFVAVVLQWGTTGAAIVIAYGQVTAYFSDVDYAEIDSRLVLRWSD